MNTGSPANKQFVLVSQETYQRLEKLGKFEDNSPEDVIIRLLNQAESRTAYNPVSKPEQKRKPESEAEAESADDPIEVTFDNLDSLPSVFHTRPIGLKVDDIPVYNPKWKSVIHAVLVAAAKKGADYEGIKKVSRANIVKGQRTDSGFRYLEELDMSVQLMDAGRALMEASHFARHFGLRVELDFVWRNKTEAALPRKLCRVRLNCD